MVVRRLIPIMWELATGAPFLRRPSRIRVKNTRFCVVFTRKRRQLRKCCKSGRSQVDPHNMGISRRGAIFAPTTPYARKNARFCVAFTRKRRRLRKCCKGGRAKIDLYNMGISRWCAIFAPTNPYARKKHAFLRHIYAQTTST